MLLRVKLENFRSFGKKREFNMFHNPKESIFPEHIYFDKEIPVLKQTVVYGSNASGKSNLVAGISFIKEFATSPNFLKKADLSDYVFRLRKSNVYISITIEFETKGRYFVYEIEVGDKGIKREVLSRSPIRREKENVFVREFQEVSFAKEIPYKSDRKADVERVVQYFKAAYEEDSFLSFLQMFSPMSTEWLEADNDFKLAFDWLKDDLLIATRHTSISEMKEVWQEQGMRNFAQSMFDKSKMGIGIVLPDDDVRKNSVGEHFPNDLTFFHYNDYGEDYPMPMRHQSDGTKQLLKLIPPLYKAINEPKTVVVDDISHSLHPSLIRALLLAFSQTPTRGQLIYTTHEIELLRDIVIQELSHESDKENYVGLAPSEVQYKEMPMLRPDEIWFVEKRYGASTLYSLNDYKLGKAGEVKYIDYYREGRFGGTFVGSFGILSETNISEEL